MYICVYTCCLTNYIIQLPRYLNLPDARCPNGSRYRSNRVHSILGLTIVMVIDTIWLAWQPFIYLSNASKCFQTHQGELANSWTDFIMAIHHYHARELCCNAVCFCFSSLFHQNASHFAIGCFTIRVHSCILECYKHFPKRGRDFSNNCLAP